MNKYLLYKLILERLETVSDYYQLVSRDNISDREYGRLLIILEAAEHDLLLSALLEQIDYCLLSQKETMNKTKLRHYQEQGEKFRSKLKQLSLMPKNTSDFH
ncbi:hypothetical protein [Crocosphaera chwakensis]|uniref:Uncharacterized protein n=1 Tax=Crocosphaera chwakensis CCY0110 TaxID=391612 RepID=A3IZ31_9CHRO|nr:hypothetical protein [Crocosphaera chwakensis]EAZ88270.1 hypothetical protein CY0110_06634 [Crocosphaera chwakensis CCY0110]